MPNETTTRLTNATERIREILERNRNGEAVGVFSICSANRYVLEAGIQQAKRDGSWLLIESTSNQVNQFGGYTGQKPADFAQFVRELAHTQDFPFENIVLGGDHLGPHVWRKEPAVKAMEKARTLVHESILAGYTKIHLDASMHCADDPGDRHRPLADEIVSARAADMCLAAEQARRIAPHGSPAPIYVIGTEVPIPGGELDAGKAPQTTQTENLEQTIQVAKEAFRTRGLEEAWERVIAIVVQPGVEFGDATVFSYDSARASDLSTFANSRWHGVYEAHSTDYQTQDALEQMVRDHFAILKVGPWLTFAFREALFALAAIEQESLSGTAGVTLSQIREVLDQVMVQHPVYWQAYYHGDEAALEFARKYSFSDRSRYYWPQPAVVDALSKLIANLSAYPPPISLLSQFLPRQADRVRAGVLTNKPTELIHSKIMDVLDVYAKACGTHHTLNGASHAK